jgi:hypothetical protein
LFDLVDGALNPDHEILVGVGEVALKQVDQLHTLGALTAERALVVPEEAYPLSYPVLAAVAEFGLEVILDFAVCG